MTEPGSQRDRDGACLSKYKKTAGFSNTLGEFFEIKMIALLFLRAIKENKNFHIAANMEAGGSFDDIVVKFGHQAIFLQLKHQEYRKAVAASQLKLMRGNFSLLKYYKSYLKVKANWGKQDLEGYGKFDDALFILFTNNILEEGIGSNSTSNAVHSLIWTAGKCTKLNQDKFYQLFDSLPHYKQLLSQAIDHPGSLTPQDSKEILDIVRVLYDNSAKSVPDKKELEKFRKDFKELQDLSCYKQFLSDMYFYSEQKSEKELQYLIKEEMKKVCGSDNKFHELIHEVHNWWKNDRFHLTDKTPFWIEIVKSIASELTECIQPWQIKFTEAERNAVKMHISQSNKICIKTTCSSLSCYKVLQSFQSELCLLVSGNAMQNHLGSVLALWKLRVYDILVVDGSLNNENEFQEISRSLEKCPCKKLVIVTSDTDNVYEDHFLTFDDCFTLSQLDLDSQTEVLKCKVNFQGFTVNVKSLANDESALKLAITANDVMKLMSGCQEFEIGCKLECPEKYYIPRTLVRKEVLSSDILLKKQSPLAVSGMPLSELQKLLPSEVIQTFDPNVKCSKDCHYFVISDMADFRALSESHTDIHWIHKTERGFVWRSSKGNMDPVICCLQPERLYYAGVEEVAKLPQQIVLIVAQPGMGKSTELTYLGSALKHENPSTWVIRVDLYRHQDFLDDYKITAYELLLNAGKFNTKFEKSLFRHQLEHDGNVVILLDGFDEINPKHTERVLSLLRDLTQTKVKTTWVTSRHVMMERLEKDLNTLSFDFELFTGEEQKEFLIKFWEQRNENSSTLHTFVSKLLEQTSRSLNDKLMKFTGIPLQTRMLAEVFESGAKHYCNTGELTLLHTLDLLHLYEWFIEKKWDIYFGKMEVSLTNAMVAEIREDLKEMFDQKLMNCALIAFLDDDDITKLGTSKWIKEENSKFLDKFKHSGERTGLIVNIVNNKAVFLHQTFAEYFVALWLSKDRYDYCKKHFFDRKFEVVRKFFDRILCKEFPLHMAILNQDKHMVKNMLSSERNCVNDEDYGGRTALFLSIINFIDLNGYVEVDDSDDFKKGCESIVETLLNYGANPNVQDRVLSLRPLELAIKIEAWAVVGLLLEKKVKREEDLIPMRDKLKTIKQNVLKVASTSGFVQLIEIVLGWGVELQEWIDDGLITIGNSFVYNKCNMLHLAARHGQMTLAKFLLNKGADMNATDVCKQTPLIYAIQHEQCKMSEFLIQQGADINMCSENKISPLLLSAQKGLGKLVRVLVEHGADVNKVDGSGNTALHFAVEKCDASSLKAMLQRRPLMQQNNKGETPLIKASQVGRLEAVQLFWSIKYKEPFHFDAALCSATEFGHLDVVDWLLQCGASVSAANSHGLTPLHIAGREGFVEIAKCLLQRDKRLIVCKEKGNTPLHVASSKGHTDVVDLLLQEQSKSLTVRNKWGDTALHAASRNGHQQVMKRLVKFGADPNIPNKRGDTPLHTAVSSGFLEAVDFLLSLKVDINACNKFKNTPLHIAAEHGNKKMAITLIQNKAKLNTVNKKDNTPLHISTMKGHQEIVEVLLEHKAKVNISNQVKDTPLHIAIRLGHNKIVELLLEHNVHIASGVVQVMLAEYDEDGYMPHHLAVQQGNLSVLQKLMQFGASYEDIDKRACTLLTLAVKMNHLHIAKWLIEQGANCNTFDKKQRTPLHLAASTGNVKIVECLIEGGADLEVHDRNHCTPLHLAARFDHAAVVKLLLQKGANKEAINHLGNTPLLLAELNGTSDTVNALQSC